ncbi:hypothetical protein L3476_04635 [Paenibacillus thiaminolyticus]|uniref:hypothetical protein n=1 Tax=Paenibacillus thiaminolyticus TaxID=49283 RepID=UPI002350999D|nr:hypothetical protein [Paenibacillus thiaminolyticus]WCR28064.1 hypothetical protein L3476_04635 [Paenibacillus thiaminolyticus]
MEEKEELSKRIQISSAGKGIDCREFVTIGGIPQYLHHRGESTDNPVMLFLHGGPGSPMLPFAQEFQLPWEKRVTVVHWDQRNSGENVPPQRSGPGYADNNRGANASGYA